MSDYPRKAGTGCQQLAGLITTIALVVGGWFGWQQLRNFNEISAEASVTSDLKEMGLAMIIYLDDSDGVFPPANTTQELEKYLNQPSNDRWKMLEKAERHGGKSV